MAEIGAADGAPESVLHEVAAAVRLDDGRILLLDGSTAQLRIFGSEGRFLAAAGGRGDGPGEFRRPVRLHLTHPDSILIDDAVLRRVSRFSTGGRFIWSEAWPTSEDPFPRDVWLHGRHLVDGPRQPDLRDAVRAALGALPRPGPGGYRTVVVDAAWRLWIRAEPHDARGATFWTVRDLEGRQLAHVRLPAGLRPTQFGADFVVGVALDSMDVERVRVYAIEGAPERVRPAVRPGAPAPAPVRSPPSADAVRRLADALSRVQAAQELYYARPAAGFTYAASVDALEIEPVDLKGVEIHVVEAGRRGYTVLAFDDRDGAACALTSGSMGPIGWKPGAILCG